MSTVAQAKRWLLVKRFTILLVVAAFLMLVVQYPRIGAVLDGLTAPQLPVLTAAAKTEAVRLDQNWAPELSQQFHSISQGTRTIPIPLSWLLALEAPHRAIVGVPFMRATRFMDDDYILRFGFIKASRNSHNPHGLPVGFATTPGQNLPGVTYSSEAVGFTCAACHTGQLTYGGKRYIVDGGPAPTDLGQLVKALGAALGQTAISAKVPFFNGRFKRFAKTVLGDSFSNQREVELRDELDAVVGVLAAQQNDVNVVEGFSRLDALNRIGNQVFAIDARRPQNYVAINAPVNYPPIWTSAWFEWVQYDGSIMGPLIRNTGEAIGVNAEMALTAPAEGGLDHPFPSRTLRGLKMLSLVRRHSRQSPSRAYDRHGGRAPSRRSTWKERRKGAPSTTIIARDVTCRPWTPRRSGVSSPNSTTTTRRERFAVLVIRCSRSTRFHCRESAPIRAKPTCSSRGPSTRRALQAGRTVHTPRASGWMRRSA